MYHQDKEFGVCVVCKNKFILKSGNQKTCSSQCRKIRMGKEKSCIQGFGLPSATVGAMAELYVSTDLMEKGYHVFRALSASSYCDLIAIETKTKQKLELEVRTGYMSYDNKLAFPTKLSKYDNGNITGYAVMERSSKKIHYFDCKKKEIFF